MNRKRRLLKKRLKKEFIKKVLKMTLLSIVL